jgi:hypothetical protein
MGHRELAFLPIHVKPIAASSQTDAISFLEIAIMVRKISGY